MTWPEYVAPVVALAGIPLAAIATWMRESRLRERQDRREDAIRREQQAREDKRAVAVSQEWKTQRWWERKAETYTSIIEALWHLFDYAREAENEMWATRQGLASGPTRGSDDFVHNRGQLKKIADVGSFIISDEVAASLTKYFQTVEAIDDYAEYDDVVATHLTAARSCLSEVRAAARRDLGICSI